MRGEGRALGLGALALLALALFVASRFEVTTDITHFLPEGRADSEVRLAKQLTSGELSRTLVLLVDAPNTEQAIHAGRAFEEALWKEERVAQATAFLEGGPPRDVEQALWTLYHPRRLGFFATDPDQVRELTTEEALRASVRRLKERLALPISGLISRVAPGDPTLILPGVFERLEGGSGSGLRIVDGRFVSEDRNAAVLFLTTHARSTDSTAQRPLLAGVRAAFERVDAQLEAPLRLSYSGASRFAIRAEEAIQADIRRVSIGSTLGLVLLFLFLFRSLRLALLVLPVISAGFLAGSAACLLCFGSVHGLTLAFGAAMIGVSVDYAVHFHCHQALAPHPGGPRMTLDSLWRGLALGAATTIAGFVALLMSSFPGLRELALFASAGILAALLATRAFLPGLSATQEAGASGAPASTRLLASWMTRLLEPRGRGTWLLALPTVAVLTVAALGLPRLRWNDGLADMNKLDPALVSEDEAVRRRVVTYEQGRLVVALGDDEQAALRVNESVAECLAACEAAGQLGGWRNVATLLPSAARQRAVSEQLRADTDLWPRMAAALEAEGFVVSGFHAFRDALRGPAPEPLRMQDLLDSPLAPLVRPFRVTLGDRVGFVSLLHELRDEEALREDLAAIPGAQLVEIEAALTRAYGTYRTRMMWLALAGLGLVVLLVALRHRALRPTLVACVPALLGAAGTVGALSLLGFELNVLSLVSLLMVVSMGVDYGVFLAESGGDPRALGATHLAVFVAGTSTLLGFGLLAFSDQPPLFSIGTAAGIGVLFCLLLAPTLNGLLHGLSGSKSDAP